MSKNFYTWCDTCDEVGPEIEWLMLGPDLDDRDAWHGWLTEHELHDLCLVRESDSGLPLFQMRRGGIVFSPVSRDEVLSERSWTKYCKSFGIPAEAVWRAQEKAAFMAGWAAARSEKEESDED